MSAKVIDCRTIAAEVKEDVKERVKNLGFSPKLTVIQIGEDAASDVYIRNKEKACCECGIDCRVIREKECISKSQFKRLISLSGMNSKVIVQLPIPKELEKLLDYISPSSDVDCLTPINQGLLFAGNPRFEPCTPAGIMKILDHENIEVDGKNVVIIGRSQIVGKPLAAMMLNANATVTVCHSHTRNLADITRQADVLVSAVGKPKFITAEMVKPDAVVIDVGINRVDGKVIGDVDFNAVSEVAGAVTAVPGGVGVMTVAMLLDNVVKCNERYKNS